jgi:copper homeostasis protein (lipoprotein)
MLPSHSSSGPAMAGFALLLLSVMVLIACSEPPAPSSTPTPDQHLPHISPNASSLTGLYVYFADSALFTDCDSGTRWPVATDAGGLELERAYLHANVDPMQPVLVELIGTIETLPGMEEGTMLPHLVVDQLIRVTDETECPQPPVELLNTQWQLHSIGDITLSLSPGARAAHLILDHRNALYGHTGCNGFRGSYQRDGDSLTVSGIAVTKMACLEGAEHESAFLEALNLTTAWHVENRQLVLMSENGTRLASFVAVVVDPA